MYYGPSSIYLIKNLSRYPWCWLVTSSSNNYWNNFLMNNESTLLSRTLMKLESNLSSKQQKNGENHHNLVINLRLNQSVKIVYIFSISQLQIVFSSRMRFLINASVASCVVASQKLLFGWYLLQQRENYCADLSEQNCY